MTVIFVFRVIRIEKDTVLAFVFIKLTTVIMQTISFKCLSSIGIVVKKRHSCVSAFRDDNFKTKIIVIFIVLVLNEGLNVSQEVS